MKIVKNSDIISLNISTKLTNEWIRESFKLKHEVILPAKTSIHLDNDVFFNTMPCCLPSLNIHCVKQINRFPENTPALEGILLLHSLNGGELLSIMDATWITTMRTGATAALAIETLKKDGANRLSIIGLGNTAVASLLSLLEYNNNFWYVKLLKYKDHAERFMDRFKLYNNIRFEVVDNNEELINGAEVILSCVTVANELFGENSWFDEGVLVVPVHTKGFQNCDLFFDKVFVDDIDHVKGFKYYNLFKSINEISDILNEKIRGRESNCERIVAYNIGIGIHDLIFAYKTYEILKKNIKDTNFKESLNKYWL